MVNHRECFTGSDLFYWLDYSLQLLKSSQKKLFMYVLQESIGFALMIKPAMSENGKPVSGSFHEAHCQKNPPAYAVWNERLKNGLPKDWPYPKEKTKSWSDDEKEKVLEALSLLPIDLLVTSVEGIHRLATYLEQPSNPAIYHGKQIALYNDAFSSKRNLAQILAHEFAHHLFNNLSFSEIKKYTEVAEWKTHEPVPGKIVLIPGRSNFVQPDGKNGVDEDFANNVEYFLFDQKTLKNISPKVFD